MTAPAPTQKYFSAKELSAEFAARGLKPSNYRDMLEIIAESPDSVGNCILLADAIAFLRSKRAQKSAHRRKKGNSPTIVTL